MARSAIIVQARLGSTRLPQKMLLKFNGTTALEFLLKRLQDVPLVDELILATTDLEEDDPLVSIARKMEVAVLRGSANDVLKRYHDAVTQFEVDTIVRICGDNILLEPSEISRLIEMQILSEFRYDYMANAMKDRTPLILTGIGLAVEVFTRGAMERMLTYQINAYHREHVTPFFYQNPHLFNLHITPVPFEILPDMRLTLDVWQDFENLGELCKTLKPPISIHKIMAFLEQNPALLGKMKEISKHHKKASSI
jgi:spore coat polysaccharide biosynthesis protein SpsF